MPSGHTYTKSTFDKSRSARRRLLGPPGLGELNDRRGGQPLGRAEELSHRGHEIPGREPVQAAAVPARSAASYAPRAAGSPTRNAAAHRYPGRYGGRFTCDACTFITPARVVTSRSSWRPLRTTSRCPRLVTVVGEPGQVGVDLGRSASANIGAHEIVDPPNPMTTANRHGRPNQQLQ
jgi:hypothetical protein